MAWLISPASVSPHVTVPAYDSGESLCALQMSREVVIPAGVVGKGGLASAPRRRQELPLCGSAQMDVFVVGSSLGQGCHARADHCQEGCD